MAEVQPNKTKFNCKEDSIAKMLVCKVHIGTKNIEDRMKSYVHHRTVEGIHLINPVKTWEKILVAARVIVAIENPSDVLVISARPFGSRAALKFAHYTGAQSNHSRWTPGMLTNQITQKFQEPRLLIVTDPRTDSQAVRESSYANVPVIALCDTDSPTQHVDIVIPCNNKTKEAIAAIYWFLAREVLYLRGELDRSRDWDLMMDMFFWRDPADFERKENEETAPAPPHAQQENWPTEGPADEWNKPTQDWSNQPAAGATAGGEWKTQPAAEGEWGFEAGGKEW